MEQNGKTRVNVEIYGTQYKVLAGSSTSIQHVQDVAKLVDEQMREISSANPRLDMPRIAVLTAVNAVDECTKLTKKCDEVTQKQLINKQLQSEQLNQINEEHSKLKQEYQSLEEQCKAQEEAYQSLLQELSKVQKERDQLQIEQANVDKLKEQLQQAENYQERVKQLQEDYEKLQIEFNEWIELVDKEKPKSNTRN
ncbi:cell division protein ZapA [Longirhabdus pacifica]|uniref:cell division protein ZapA n=1 Tax=Longirhabdus pacifica TaxID=2305227 RepID=UPI0010088475